MQYHRLKKILITLFFISLFLPACYELPDRIIFPEWDTELNIPITNRRMTIDELIKEQDQIEIEGTTIQDSIYVIESDLYNLNSDISKFIKLNGSSGLDNVPVLTNQPEVTLYIPFPSGAEIDSALFLSGKIKVTVTNPSSEETTLQLTFPGIKNASGNQLVLNVVNPPASTKVLNYDLKNHHYNIVQNQPPEFKNSFQLIASATSQSGNSEQISVDFSASDIMFSYVAGVLPPTSLGEKSKTFGFAPENLSDYRDNATLKEAKMVLDANFISQFDSPFPIDVKNLNIIGLRSDGLQFVLKDSTGSENIFIHIENGSTKKEFNQDNSNITDFVSFLPDSILIRAEYLMNPTSEHGSAALSDSIKFEVTTSTKSIFALKRSSIKDSTEIELTSDDRDAIRDGNSASFVIEFENAVPLSGWLKIDLVDENHNHLFTISKNSDGTDTLTFNAAIVDENGEVIQSTVNPPVTVELDSAEIQMLADARFAIFDVAVETSGADNDPPPIVAVRPNAWMKLRTYGKVNYRVKPEDY